MFVIESGFASLVLALSFLSGIGSFLQGRREGRLNGFFDLMAEVTLASIVGLVVAYLGETQGLDRGYTCAFVLVLSNNGSDTLLALRKNVVGRLNSLLSFGGKLK
ncbi:hypothetical protein [Vibrio fluvialis]|uniref:hypothetical protein n=1 Tax=Vibrio fluvialis TaxID=676 RepID=UPI001EEAEEB4|nr:hypothetical protein [Vibrio fluvialis]MCG6387484.1 hypothetical protein [Vibrio fluvialis]